MALRAVQPDEKPPTTRRRRKSASVAAAVAANDSLEVFEAMERRIAKAIDEPNIRGADLAALSRRLHELRKEIEAIHASEKQEGAERGVVPDQAFDASAV